MMKIFKAKPLPHNYIVDSDRDVWILVENDCYSMISGDTGQPTTNPAYRDKTKEHIRATWSIVEESYTMPKKGRNI